MAKGANIGFLNFGIDGDNKELLKKLEQAKKEAVSIEQIFKNIKLNTGGNSISTDVQKAQIASDKLAISQNKVTQSAMNAAKAEKQVEIAVVNENNAKAKGLILENQRQTALQRSLLYAKQGEAVSAESARKEVLAKQKLLIEEERLNGIRKRNSLIGVQGQKDLATAYGLTNKTMFSQKNLLQQLSSAAGIYFSVYQVAGFVKELATVSGEFEKQRVSLAAIIGDADAANKIFNQLKDLAVISPFNFKELTDYAKQLSAFSIPTNEIYDTTKRLADLSAGLGVDMSRIILAYGQVRSAAVLRGQELRQFTEAGIPLVDELAKKFGELEGRVDASGKSLVSAGEVFDNISARKVPFEMVKDIITELTSEGGKFFEMQELQSATLAGKISNLRDNYDMMLDSLGKANSGLLHGAMDGIVEVMDNWEKYWNVLKDIIVLYGSYRAALIAVSAAQKTIALYNQISFFINLSKALTGASTAATVMTGAMNGLKAAMATNPYTLAALAITALAYGIYKAATSTNELEESQKRIVETTKKFNASIESERLTLDYLFSRLRNAKEGTAEYDKAKDTITSKYGKYLSGLSEEIKALKNVEGAYKAISIAALQSARDRAMEEAGRNAADSYSESFADNLAKIQDEFISKYGKSTGKLYVDELKAAINSGNFSATGKGLSKELQQAINSFQQGIYFGTDEMGERNPIKNWLLEIKKSRNAYDSELEKLVGIFGEPLQKEKTEGVETIVSTLENQVKSARESVSKLKLELTNLQKGVRPSNVTDDEYFDFAKGIDEKAKELTNAENKLNTLLNVNKKDKGSSSSKDPLIDTLQKQIDLIKSAQSEYEKLSKLMSNDEAYTKLTSLAPFKYISKSDLTSEGLLEVISKQLESFNGKTVTDDQRKYIISLFSLQNDTAQKIAKSNIEKIEKELSQYKDQYSLYEYIFGKTGDKGQAMKIAFGDTLESFRKEMLSSFANGNVDLLARPLIDAAELVKKGWEDAGEGIATVFSSQFRISDAHGNEHEILITPILPDGTVLSPTELEDYVDNILNDAEDILKADSKGIVIAIDVDKDGTAGDRLHELQEGYYGLTGQVKTYRDALVSAIEKTTDSDQKKKLQEQLIDFDFTQKSDFSKRMTDLVLEFQSIDEQITTIKAKGEATRIEIEKNADNASRTIVEQRMKANQDLVNKQIADLTSGVLQSTEAYQRLFGDIADISQKELQYLIDKWKNALSEATKNADGSMTVSIDGSQFQTTEKEIASFTKRILKSESELRSRNPFKALKDSLSELKANRAEIDSIKSQIDSLNNSIKLAENSKSSGSTNPLNDAVISSSKVKITELQDKLKDLGAKGATSVQKVGTAFAAIGSEVSSISQSLSGMFDSLGNEDLADTIGLVGELAGAAADIGQGLASKNPVQVIQGIAKGISSIANFHDKKLDKAIKRSQLEVKKLQNAYAQLERFISRQLGSVSERQANDMINNQKKQITELNKQIAAERSKKKSDRGAILDMESQLAEAKDKLKYFYEDLANEQYGINIKDWASQISSALVDAFASGENAAKAFDNTVADIMRNVIKNMINLSVIEPAMQSLRDKLFGEGGLLAGGTTNLSNADGAEIIKELVSLKDKITNAKDIWDYLSQAAKEAGISLENQADKDTLSKGIQSITEDTGDLLASYLNAMRADLAAQKQFVQQLVTIAQLHTDQFANMYAELLRIQVNTLATANNTAVIAETTTATYNLLRQATVKGSGTAINLA